MSKTVRAQRWPGDQPGAMKDWITISLPPASEEEEARILHADMSFLLSWWGCIYGEGCPSVMVNAVDAEAGCCQIGVGIYDQEYPKMKRMVEQLTPDDCDNYDLLMDLPNNKSKRIRHKWHRDMTEDDYPTEGQSKHTLVVDGVCIFSNRSTGKVGSKGKVGCAFHHLAARTGVHYAETKPEICWQIPLAWSEEWDENTRITTCSITGTPGHMWGEANQNAVDFPGYWCVESPDAYGHGDVKDMVFFRNEYELRKIMGDATYDLLAEKVTEYIDRGGRFPMPGETANNGRKLIPLLVKNRMKVWEVAGDTEAIERSHKYGADVIKQGEEAVA